MRNLFSKTAAGAMLAGAALSMAACHKSDDAANTADTNMTDMNTMDSSAGMTNDMSATDTGGNMATDNAMMGGNESMGGNGAMGGNDTMAGNASNAM